MEQKTYGVWAVRSSGSIFGHAEAWCKEDGRPIEFDSEEAAKAYASELNSGVTVNVRYYVKEKEPEPGAVRKTATQEDLTENYLLNAELHKEAQTGNYNMLDGRLDNEAPVKPDLTDGLTYDELRELAPEMLPEEKTSVLDQLKAGCPEHEPRQLTSSNPEREL